MNQSEDDSGSGTLTLKYYSDGKYYALIDKNRWRENRIHEAELHEVIMGKPKEELFESHVLKAMGGMVTRIWKGRKHYEIENSRAMKAIFPYILVQSVPYDLFQYFFLQ